MKASLQNSDSDLLLLMYDVNLHFFSMYMTCCRVLTSGMSLIFDLGLTTCTTSSCGSLHELRSIATCILKQ